MKTWSRNRTHQTLANNPTWLLLFKNNSIFGHYSGSNTRSFYRGRVTWVRSINFMTQSLLSLVLNLELLLSSRNVELGPRFAKIWTPFLLLSVTLTNQCCNLHKINFLRQKGWSMMKHFLNCENTNMYHIRSHFKN